jgi:hypothetical protein
MKRDPLLASGLGTFLIAFLLLLLSSCTEPSDRAADTRLANHYTPEQAAAFVLVRFNRRITADLEMIELVAENRD